MASKPWGRLEAAFDALSIRPLVAVTPDCRHPRLLLEPPDPGFWPRVRGWRNKGWTIALHGLHHLYHPDPPDSKTLVPFNQEGEFVGLSLAQQRTILKQSWKIFCEQDVQPEWFIAPSHSFDRNTLEALRLETDVRGISDGLSFRPFARYGFQWLPQQLWEFRDYPFGLWTICLHPNNMTDADLNFFVEHFHYYRDRIAAVSDFPFPFVPYDIADASFEHGYWAWRTFKRRIRRVLSYTRWH